MSIILVYSQKEKYMFQPDEREFDTNISCKIRNYLHAFDYNWDGDREICQ